MTRKRQAIRCSGTNRRGLPCGNYAVLGMRVCYFHGGAAPHVRAKARRMLTEADAARALAAVGDRRLGTWRLGGRLPFNRAEWRQRDAAMLARLADRLEAGA